MGIRENSKEKIIKIEERTFRQSYNDYDGYQIYTTDQNIFIGIDSIQNCCENWGYIVSEDDISSFIGSELLNVEIVDTQLKNIELQLKELDVYNGQAIFINLVTSAGILQFAVYNDHNGYYGHEVIIRSNQLTYNDFL